MDPEDSMNEDGEGEEEEMSPEEANTNLLQACKDNDEELALEYLSK